MTNHQLVATMSIVTTDDAAHPSDKGAHIGAHGGQTDFHNAR